MKPQTFEAIFTQGVCSEGHVRNFLEIASCQKEAGSSSNHQFSGARVCGPTPFSTSKRYSNFEIMATIDTKSLALYTLTIKKSSLPQGIQGNVPSHLHFMGFISAANPGFGLTNRVWALQGCENWTWKCPLARGNILHLQSLNLWKFPRYFWRAL